MITPREFEQAMTNAVESGDTNMHITALCVKEMMETLDLLGYSRGVEVFKKYVDCAETK